MIQQSPSETSTQTPALAVLANWPDHARIWCYVADRALSETESARAQDFLAAFTQQWTAHQHTLKAYSTVLFDRMLVLGVDQTAAGASGCSIDSSVRAIRQLGDELQIDFFDRLIFLTYDSSTQAVTGHHRDAFAEDYAAGKISTETFVVDPLIERVSDVRTGLIKTLGESWHSRMV